MNHKDMPKEMQDVVKGIDLLTLELKEGVKVKCVTISELAKMAGRKPNTIRVLENKGKFPTPNYRTADTENKHGVEVNGQRMYTLEAADEYDKVVRTEVKQGVEITERIVTKFFKISKDEKLKYA